ncbi:hypothetical protein E2C01_029528 [Portunus trituberculatus]|uniref:Uncharacterized protein n=1 Tax=Portunus trituberculatus TaxID=210409 RepID=A0A5B7EN62_PORTR|nr:hypothetical protein [Portunus trituberculatus]
MAKGPMPRSTSCSGEYLKEVRHGALDHDGAFLIPTITIQILLHPPEVGPPSLHRRRHLHLITEPVKLRRSIQCAWTPAASVRCYFAS